MSAQIDFTDFIMSRYARKATKKGKMIGRMKKLVLEGINLSNWVVNYRKDKEASADDRFEINEIIKDWSKELKKIEAGTSKVEKFAGGQPIGTSSELDRALETIGSWDTTAGDPYEGLSLDLGAFYEEVFG